MKNPALIIVMLLFGSLLHSQVLIDKVVGVVGNQVVLKSDVEIQVGQLRAQSKKLPPEVRCKVMDQLMMQKLLISQAKVDSIVVSDDQVEAELNNRMRYFINMFGSQEKLEEFYKKSVLEIKEEYRSDIREQLLAEKMRSEITSDISVTPEEVREFFKRIPEDSLPYFNAEVQVGHIVILAKPSEAQWRQSYEKIKEIRKEIVEEGADFATKAVLYSDDPGTAANGGELPEFTREDPYDPAFIGVAFSLEEGEVSEPFKTEFGYHIMQLMYRRGDRVKVRHILIKPDITGKNMEEVREKADTVYHRLISGKLSFAEAAMQYSDDENTNKYGGLFTNPQTGDTYFEIPAIGALDREIPFIIDTMESGEYSTPVVYKGLRGEKGYRIVYLKSVTEPHVANLEQDYPKIQKAALAKKKDRELREWMKGKISKTYIRIDDSYKDCENLKVWKQEIDLN